MSYKSPAADYPAVSRRFIMTRFKQRMGRLAQNPIIRIIWGIGVLFAVPVLANRFILKPVFSSIFQNRGTADTIRYLAAFILFGAIYAAIVRLSEKRPVSELGTAGLGRNISLGIAFAAGAMGIIVGIFAVAGLYTIDGVNSGFAWIRISAAIVVLAFGEELMFRGILFRIAEHAFGILPALASSAVLFGAMHVVNPGAYWAGTLSAVLGGIIAGLLFAWRRNIWLCTAFHAGWNMSQVVLGSNVSGLDPFGAFFKGKLSGPELLTGGTFGIEASLVTLVVLAMMAVGLGRLILGRRPSSS